jgi:hypothetical protein
MLDITFNNPTKQEFLNKINSIKLKDYTLIKTKDNFFIWKSKKGNRYKRLCLIRKHANINGELGILFYWNYESDFIPSSYKHNHRENANQKSETFQAKEEDKFYNYFLNMLDIIKKR